MRIAAVAKPEDQDIWLKRARTMSVRVLDNFIRDQPIEGTTLRVFLTEGQFAVWELAMELCRKAAGVELSPARCLEYMAAEFIGTWGQLQDDNDDDDASGGSEETLETSGGEETPAAVPELVAEANADPGELSEQETYRLVYERDGYSCCYPGCTARAELHPHHIELRSRFGKKGRRQRDDPSNIVTVCEFHHSLRHDELIGIKGKAPFQLRWEAPALMKQALLRLGDALSLFPGDARLLHCLT